MISFKYNAQFNPLTSIIVWRLGQFGCQRVINLLIQWNLDLTNLYLTKSSI